MLVVSPAGLDAIGVEPEDKEPAAGKRGKPRPDAPMAQRKRKAGSRKTQATPKSVRPGAKLALLTEMLGRDRGATVPEIVTATGWQPHSVRGAISGSLKKKRGLTVTSEKTADRGRVYRIDGRT